MDYDTGERLFVALSMREGLLATNCRDLVDEILHSLSTLLAISPFFSIINFIYGKLQFV